ncbi:MAG: celA [Clostridia bacterium]|nr:celA [Clostridia bacterium]
MLKVKGNKVLNDNNKVVLLRGVNRAGLEWSAKDTLIIKSICAACDDWNANVIRLPVSQDRWFGKGPDQDDFTYTAEAYRKLVDDILAELSKRNKYLLLDLHWSDCGNWGRNIGQHKLPDENSIIFWRDAATRYKNHPNILFGLYNEPHDVSWEDWHYGGRIEEKGIYYRGVGMQELLDEIRSTDALNIAVIGGLDWGYTLDGIPKKHEIKDLRGNGIIYDSHVYPWKELDWDNKVSIIADKHPILIGECGHYGDEAKPKEGVQRLPCGEWMPRLLNWIEEHNYHLTAWDFHPGAGPCLIKNFENEPTAFNGVFVKEFLKKQV